MRKLTILIGFLLCFLNSFGFASLELSPPPQNVIFITLDGVRWQELFEMPEFGYTFPGEARPGEGPRFFKNFWKDLVLEGVLYGNPRTNAPMSVANPYLVSLPAYQSIFTGKVGSCSNNECDHVTIETFPERLVRELKLSRSDVASFASWNKIANAVESRPGRTLVNAGNVTFSDFAAIDPYVKSLNQLQGKSVPPWHDARYDQYTFDHALHYLEQYQPRFLYISLNDSDEYAHANQYANYVRTLHKFDRYIRELNEKLKNMGEYGENTTLIITTDHGRGKNNKWTSHGASIPEARPIWLFAKGPFTPKRGVLRNQQTHTHLDIRPTIETIFGLCPKKCAQCGTTMKEVVRYLKPNPNCY